MGRKTWSPQPGPQRAFVRCSAFEVIYGGARGGGKTDAALGEFAQHARIWKRAAQGLFVRRTRTALEPTIERAKAIFGPERAKWEAGRSRFTWKSGAALYFRHLARDSDAEAYQGHSYSRVYVEELTQFADPKPIDRLKATLRSPTGAPTSFRATCNPICAAARACQGFCRSELEVFRSALGPGVAVERIDHLLAGARRCAYRIRAV